MIDSTEQYKQRLREYYDSLVESEAPYDIELGDPLHEELLRIVADRSPGREERFVELVVRMAQGSH